MKTALGYIRRSVIKVGQRTDSPAKQRANIERICADKGWQVEWYEDAAEGKHFSGRSEEHRPAWQELKRQLTRPDVAAVAVNSLDRASRSPKDFFNFLDELEKHDVALVSCKEQFDTTTPMGRAFLGILMIVASLESDMASERVSSTIAFRKDKGLHWGNTPYGYQKLDDGTMVESKDAPTIREVYELYASGQWSYYGIAQHLNDQGHRMTNRHRERKPFDKKNIRIFIQNHWLYRGWIMTNGHNGNHVFEHDEINPPDGAVPGQFPPLISEDLAVSVAQALKMRQNMAPKRRPDHVYLLTPILHCALCGEPLRGKPTRDAYYYAHSKQTCLRGYGNIPEEPLDQQMIDMLRDFRIPDNWRAALQQKLQERIAAIQSPAQRQVTEDVARLHRSLERLRNVYVYGDIEPEEYERQRDALREKIAVLQTQQVQPPYEINELLQRLETIGARIALANRDKQKQLIEALFTRLETKKNDAGEWVISSAVVRPIFADFFIDLKKVRQSVPPREFESLSQP